MKNLKLAIDIVKILSDYSEILLLEEYPTKDDCTYIPDVIREATQELENLKCCGNCDWMLEYVGWDEANTIKYDCVNKDSLQHNMNVKRCFKCDKWTLLSSDI